MSERVIGIVRSLIYGRQFGFILHKNQDYFFHKDDYSGDFEALIQDHNNRVGNSIKVSFEPAESQRGLRAAHVEKLGD